MQQRTIPTIAVITLKLALSAISVWFVTHQINVGRVLAVVREIEPARACIALGIFSLHAVLTSERQRTLSFLFTDRLFVLRSLQISLAGAFCGQVLATFASGDAIRIWLLKKNGMSLFESSIIIVLDRALGFAGLSAFVIIAALAVRNDVLEPTLRVGLFAVATGAGIATVAFFVLGVFHTAANRSVVSSVRRAMNIVAASRFLYDRPGIAAHALLLSTAIQLANIIAVYELGIGLGLNASVMECMMFVPVILLITMLPISVAGWGVREGAMVVGFTAVGHSAEAAVATSLVFGLCVLLFSLPGVFTLMFPLVERNPPPG